MADYRAAPTAGAYQTTVQLLRVPLRIDDENQMYFANQTAQNNYFQSVIWKSLPSQTYQRENAYFRVDDDYDAIVTNCNYLRYRNAITGNKWFYAYITEFEYKNPNTTFVHFKIDAYQTYMFDITWKDCYIEREHVKDDSMGAHYLKEDFNIPRSIIKSSKINIPYSYEDNGSIQLVPVLMLSQQPTTKDKYSTLLNGEINNTIYWIPDNVQNPSWEYNIKSVMQSMSALIVYLSNNENAETIDSIVGSFSVPRFALFGVDTVPLHSGEISLGQTIRTPMELTSVYTKANTQKAALLIDKPDFNFQPKNNKIYTSQFFSVSITNMQGIDAEYKTEFLDYTDALENWGLNYVLQAAVSPESCIYLYVDPDVSSNGKYQNTGIPFAIPLDNFPVPAITGDYYNAWLSGHAATSRNTLAISMLSGVVGMAATAGGNPAGMALMGGSVISIANTLSAVEDASNRADPLKIESTNTARYACGRAKYMLTYRYIGDEDAKAVDNYFTMFGYKVNELKVPEFGTRQYYNYYKMPVCNITGNIPQTALDEIRAKFQRGITLWNTPDVGNYRNGNNPIVTS